MSRPLIARSGRIVHGLHTQIPQDELTSMEKSIAVKAHEQVLKVLVMFELCFSGLALLLSTGVVKGQ